MCAIMVLEKLKNHSISRKCRPEDLEKELGGCKFAVEEIFSDVAGSPYDPQANEFAVIAKKL
jgi:hypothetical protein